jgi:hypothetical protein
MEKRDYHLMLLNAQADALSARILLDELRAGRTAVALELLEQRLDTSVLLVGRFAREVEPTKQASAIQSLRVVRQYRLRHPRKTEAVIEEREDNLSGRQTQERVKNILDEISDA